MTSGSRLWLSIGLGAAVALCLLLALSPARPPLRLPGLAQPAAGLAAGLLLYAAVTRSRPFPPVSASLPVLAAKYGIFGLLATSEEIVWRRVALGELLRAGSVAAVAASAVGFALAHRARPGLHLATGAALGSLYASTGALVACITAHWIYNVLVSTCLDRAPRSGGAAQ